MARRVVGTITRLARPSSNRAGLSVIPTTGLPCFTFASGSDETLYIDFRLDDTYRAGKAVYLRRSFCANSTAGGDYAVSIACEHWSANDARNAQTFGAADTDDLVDSTTAYGRVVAETELTNFPGAAAAGDAVRISDTRDVSEEASGVAADILVETYELVQ